MRNSHYVPYPRGLLYSIQVICLDKIISLISVPEAGLRRKAAWRQRCAERCSEVSVAAWEPHSWINRPLIRHARKNKHLFVVNTRLFQIFSAWEALKIKFSCCCFLTLINLLYLDHCFPLSAPHGLVSKVHGACQIILNRPVTGDFMALFSCSYAVYWTNFDHSRVTARKVIWSCCHNELAPSPLQISHNVRNLSLSHLKSYIQL